MCGTLDTGSIPVLRSRLGSPPNRSIILDNVVCTGSEENLSECDHNGVGVNNCDRSEEAGVKCEGTETLAYKVCSRGYA